MGFLPFIFQEVVLMKRFYLQAYKIGLHKTHSAPQSKMCKSSFSTVIDMYTCGLLLTFHVSALKVALSGMEWNRGQNVPLQHPL